MPFIFDKKPEIEREKFREATRKRLKGGTQSPELSFQDKMKIEKKIFGPRYIEKISQDDYIKALIKMDRLKLGAKTETDRRAIESRVRYLKRIGGIKSLKNSSQPKEPKKEQKKDPSLFGGRPYLKKQEIGRLFKQDWAWRITKLPANERSKLAQIFPKEYGSYIDPREANKTYDDLRNYPTTRAKTKYGMKNRRETVRTVKLLKKFLGK